MRRASCRSVRATRRPARSSARRSTSSVRCRSRTSPPRATASSSCAARVALLAALFGIARLLRRCRLRRRLLLCFFLVGLLFLGGLLGLVALGGAARAARRVAPRHLDDLLLRERLRVEHTELAEAVALEQDEQARAALDRGRAPQVAGRRDDAVLALVGDLVAVVPERVELVGLARDLAELADELGALAGADLVDGQRLHALLGDTDVRLVEDGEAAVVRRDRLLLLAAAAVDRALRGTVLLERPHGRVRTLIGALDEDGVADVVDADRIVRQALVPADAERALVGLVAGVEDVDVVADQDRDLRAVEVPRHVRRRAGGLGVLRQADAARAAVVELDLERAAGHRGRRRAVFIGKRAAGEIDLPAADEAEQA